MSAWKVPSGPYRLVPHPLDSLGPPPPPGPDYETSDLEGATAYADALIRADELRDEADEMRQRADDAEDDADTAVHEADEAGHKALDAAYPRLVAAIKADPTKFVTVSAVRRWLDGTA